MEGGRREHGKVVTYILNILIGIDQLANAILFGDPDETLSSRFGKWMRDDEKGSFRYRLAYIICRTIHLFDKQHCEDAIEDDEGKWAVIRGKKREDNK